MEPVTVPPLKRGDDPRAKLAQTRDALFGANKRLVGSKQWYDQVRERAAEQEVKD